MSDEPTTITLVIDDTAYETAPTPKFSRRRRWTAPDRGQVSAHIPGVIGEIYVEPGLEVRWGDRLLVLEAMKMKNDVRAPRDGVVKAIHAVRGEMVGRGDVLVEFE